MTLELVLQWIGAAFLLGGSFFCIVGGIGLVRLPTFYTRCHAAGVTDSAGAAGVLIGLAFVSTPLVAFKLVTVLAFVWLTSVASTHALVKAAHARGVRVMNTPRLDWTIPPPAPDDGEVDPTTPPSDQGPHLSGEEA